MPERLRGGGPGAGGDNRRRDVPGAGAPQDATCGYLGIDVGSVSTNLVALSCGEEVLADVYIRTGGDPLRAVQEGLRLLRPHLPEGFVVLGAATTGSARQLTGVFVGADLVKNEITCHAVAAQKLVPDVRTVLEIGGQDSKIVILRQGVAVDFAMNTVCAAGTGSFLDRQAARLGLPIERFGDLAFQSQRPVRIAGRCAVFAESDMVHKQQVGHRVEDIVWGLCQALVRNYLNNVAKGKEILAPVVFQGGVASNQGMKRAFEEALGMEVVIPPYHKVMGAIGAAMLVREEMARARPALEACCAAVTGGLAASAGDRRPPVAPSRFRGFGLADLEYSTGSFDCDGCPNRCEVVEVFLGGRLAARWGGRCERWEVGEAGVAGPGTGSGGLRPPAACNQA